VRGSFHRLRRGTSARNSADLRRLLQFDQNTPVVGQRCTGFAPVQRIGSINSYAILDGLHHHYVRVFGTHWPTSVKIQFEWNSGAMLDLIFRCESSRCTRATSPTASGNSRPFVIYCILKAYLTLATLRNLELPNDPAPQSEGPPNSKPTLCAIAMPMDTNPHGDIFGGWLISQMDLAGSAAATRRAKGRVVTVAITGMNFHRPVRRRRSLLLCPGH
jgi:hypothetical protein